MRADLLCDVAFEHPDGQSVLTKSLTADDGGLIILEVRTRAVGGGDVITRAVVFAADDKKLAVVYADIIAAQDVGGFVDAFGNAGDEIVFFVELAGV
jgi:hypothetical protein